MNTTMMEKKDKLMEFAMESMGEDWANFLDGVIHSLYFVAAATDIASLRGKGKTIYPLPHEKHLMFRAFKETPLDSLKVVILGQDPYHNGAFDGLAFSNGRLDYNHPGEKYEGISPSLRVIFKEIENSCYNGLRLEQDPDLKRWANQGVLLMNTAFTVERGVPSSHMEIWEPITVMILDALSQRRQLVYILWGQKALATFRKSRIKTQDNCVITSPHPAAELRQPHAGFLGSKCFVRANEYLTNQRGVEPIKW